MWASGSDFLHKSENCFHINLTDIDFRSGEIFFIISILVDSEAYMNGGFIFPLSFFTFLL